MTRRHQRGFVALPAGLGLVRPAVGGGVGSLDSYLTDLWGAYGLTKLNGAYGGPALRVRRSSDNSEQNIAFSGADLDVAALLSFVGANSGYVVTWYDQSGTSNDITNATAAAQPLLVDAGVYTGELLFDGVDDQLLGSVTIANNTARVTQLYAGRSRIGGRTESHLFMFYTGAAFALVGTDRDAGQFPSRWIGLKTDRGDTGGAPRNFFANSRPTLDSAVYAFVHKGDQSTISLQVDAYIDGALQTATSQTGANITTPTYQSMKICLGGSTSSWARSAFKTLLVYQAEVTAGDIAAISAIIKPVAPTLGLDSYTSNLKGLFSLRKQLTAYGGSCIRVRRSSDNTEQDIGFDSDDLLDTASLLSFAGAGSAFVVTWYDQSGNTFDFTQAATTQQPRIVNSGVMDFGVTFDGSDDLLATAAAGTTPAAWTVIHKSRSNATSLQVFVEYGPGTHSTDGCAGFLFNGGSYGFLGNAAGAYVQGNYSSWSIGQMGALRFDRAGSGNSNKLRSYSGGLLKTLSYATSGTVSASFASQSWRIGRRTNGTTYPFSGEFESIAIYESAVSDADIERISRALG